MIDPAVVRLFKCCVLTCLPLRFCLRHPSSFPLLPAAHLAPPVRRPRFSPAPAPPRRSHSPLYPGDVPRRPLRAARPSSAIDIDLSDSDDVTYVGTDNPIAAARPRRARAEQHIILNNIEFSDADDGDDDEFADRAELELDFLRQHNNNGGRMQLYPFEFEAIVRRPAAAQWGAAAGVRMQRPIGLEQQWRDAGAFAPPEPLPTRRLYSRNCELEVQGVEDSSEEEGDEEEQEVERSLLVAEGEGEGGEVDPVTQLKTRRQTRTGKRKAKSSSSTGLTFGCSSCARPLLLSAATASRRIWALSCGHLVDGWCLSHLYVPASPPPYPLLHLSTLRCSR